MKPLHVRCHRWHYAGEIFLSVDIPFLRLSLTVSESGVEDYVILSPPDPAKWRVKDWYDFLSHIRNIVWYDDASTGKTNSEADVVWRFKLDDTDLSTLYEQLEKVT